MVERLRTLLERPLDPSVARAILMLALAASIGFAAVVLLGGVGDRPAAVAQGDHGASRRRAGARHARRLAPASPAEVAGQDREDRPGTVVHRRALEEVAAHRALQHVPYRAGGVSIELVGARRGRAVLQVDAPTIVAARIGWRRFLRRFDDPGRAYLPRFGPGGRRGSRRRG